MATQRTQYYMSSLKHEQFSFEEWCMVVYFYNDITWMRTPPPPRVYRQHWQRQHSDRPDGVNMDTCNGHSILMSTAERGRREPSGIRVRMSSFSWRQAQKWWFRCSFHMQKGSQRKMLPNVKLTPAQLVYVTLICNHSVCECYFRPHTFMALQLP